MSAEAHLALVPRERLGRHPAARGWRRLRPGAALDEIRVLKEPSKGVKKSAVYRLDGAGPGGRPVIAKLALRDSAALEARVYERFLGPIGLPAPAYYGTLDDDGPYRWLFIGDASGRRYSPADPRHRRLAGRWIARLHEGASSLPGAERLPDRGTAHHLEALGAARGAMLAHGDDPSLAPAEASVLRHLAVLLEEVRASWVRMEEICAELPPTLVHGDLVRKNLRIRAVAGGVGAIAFDWENSGWGPPALDLAQSATSERFAASACLEAYRSTRGPVSLPPEQVERQAAAGTALRFLAAIRWASLSLGPRWREGDAARPDFVAKRPKTLPRLEAYLAGLERSWRTLEARGWV